MNVINTLKKESVCDAEIYVAKKHLINRPVLSWNRVYDLQDNISYIVEFDGKEYECKEIKDEKKILWKVPIELERNKIYSWRVKSYDGYEYSDYSKTQYLQYSNYDQRYLSSYIYVKEIQNSDIEAEVEVLMKTGNDSLNAEISIVSAKKFQPCVIDVEICRQTILPSIIEVKNRDCRQLNAELFIKTKKLLPPKGPLAVDMQSEMNYVTGDLTPIFSWWKSLDELFSDDIYYEIQIGKDMFFDEDNLVFQKSDIKNPISDQMVYPLPYCLEKGTYCWRVRACDDINKSEWAYGTDFTIDFSTDNLEAEIFVMEYLQRQDLEAEIFIKDKYILESEIQVKGHGNCFMPCITRVWAKKSEFLECSIHFSQEGWNDLLASIDVYGSQLKCELDVYPQNTIYNNYLLCECVVPTRDYLPAKLEVPLKGFSEINPLLFVKAKSDGYLESEIFILKNKLDIELEAEINIVSFQDQDFLGAYIDIHKTKYYTYESTLSAKLNIPVHVKIEKTLKSQLEVLLREEDDLEAFVNVEAIKQHTIKIICEQEEDKWYNNNKVGFSWEFNYGNIIGYVMQFNDDKDYIPKLGRDYYEHEHGNKMFVANVHDISGEYYFHILGFDENYNKTPVSHYRILYNNAPTPPKHLRVNGEEFSDNGKIVSKKEENIFSWDNSFDKDQNDSRNIKYELVICNKQDFEYLDYESGFLEENQLKISFRYLNLSGKYYWKVRTFDGKEYSEWSEISTFIINKPPSIPTDIEFFSK